MKVARGIPSFGVLLDPALLTTNTNLCKTLHPDQFSIIQRFCQITDMVVPSSYATEGILDKTVSVNIVGNCDPPQWVPQEYCFAQFYYMCAHEKQELNYGHNTCQYWQLG